MGGTATIDGLNIDSSIPGEKSFSSVLEEQQLTMGGAQFKHLGLCRDSWTENRQQHSRSEVFIKGL